jgi:hypothetical protein
MFISSSGLIGINKSSSNATLDVNGNTLTSGSSTWVSPGFANGYISPGSDGISIGNSNSGVHIRIRNSNRTSFDQSCGFGGAGSFGMTTSDRITSLTGGTTSGQTGLWVGSSANFNIFKVQGDSRVGINIATATSALHIQGTGTTSATTALTVQNANASASLTILDNGNIGIGNPSPTASLQIGNGTTSTNSLYIGGSVATTQTIGFAVNGSTVYHGLTSNANSGEFRIGAGFNGGGHYIVFSSGTNIERMRITPSGNTLIGKTIDGNHKLDVSGSGNFTNGLTVTGSLIVTGGITGSLLGTASYATQALSASFSLTASYIDGGTF